MKKKESQWFTHEVGTYNTPQMLELIENYGMTGYGYWWILIEILRMEEGYKYDISKPYHYNTIALAFRQTKEEVKVFIDDCINKFDLLQTDGTYIWSESLLERMQHLEKRRETYKVRGSKGGQTTKANKLAKTQLDSSKDVAGEQLLAAHNITLHNTTKQNNKEEEIPPATPTTNFISSEAVVPIATLQQNVMNDEIYFVTPICMQFGIEPEKVNQWLTAFNKQLGAESQHYKIPRDYRKHFLHWLKYQDVARGDPAKWKPVTNPRQQKGNSSPPPQPTAEEVLAQRAAEEEYYNKLGQQLKP
jgi:hypothetical protein